MWSRGQPSWDLICFRASARYRSWDTMPHRLLSHMFSTVTPKSDQCQISPAVSPEILHHTVWRTWLFMASLKWKMIILPILTTSVNIFLPKRLGECTFWTWEWQGFVWINDDELNSELRVQLNDYHEWISNFWERDPNSGSRVSSPVRHEELVYQQIADLDGTTSTQDCRMQLAQVMTCVRLSQGVETAFKILQLFSSCMRQSWESWGWFTRNNPCRMDDASKLHATVVSQSCAV